MLGNWLGYLGGCDPQSYGCQKELHNKPGHSVEKSNYTYILSIPPTSLLFQLIIYFYKLFVFHVYFTVSETCKITNIIFHIHLYITLIFKQTVWTNLFNGLYNGFRNRTRVANTSHATIAYNVKAQLLQIRCNS